MFLSTRNFRFDKSPLDSFENKLEVQKMNELGMMIDMSHLGDQSFWDVIKITTKPIIASHSSVYSLVPHRRNLKDDQIKAIAKKRWCNTGEF